jgi:hypothetical protein
MRRLVAEVAVVVAVVAVVMVESSAAGSMLHARCSVQ